MFGFIKPLSIEDVQGAVQVRMTKKTSLQHYHLLGIKATRAKRKKKVEEYLEISLTKFTRQNTKNSSMRT